MIPRSLESNIVQALHTMPVVAILGPRQVGKTTLALEIANNQLDKEVAYLDLELDSDLAKLNEPEDYLKRFENKLLIIDEVQRKPDLFRILRSLVDMRKRAGEKAGHFLLLGSASRDLLQHSTETLAGRIRYLELSPFSIPEIYQHAPDSFDVDKLWFRGGFPDSYLAGDDDESWDWRSDFIASYVERDIPLMGPRVPAERMKRFWSMLAHWHSQQVNLSSLGKSLEVDHKTIRSYLDILTDFYMVRQLQPWSGNTKKRLVKSPKVYIRDSGMLHRLLNISDHETLLGHPVLGASWEGFVLESIVSSLSSKWQYSYYRTSSQAEIDLVLEGPKQAVIAVEIKRSSSPKLTRGFHLASEDIKATKKFVIYSGQDRFTLADNTEAISLTDFLSEVGK
ncbi:MAG: ATP-binding protein [Oceanicoccus sp.]|uniref:ATP-binding protein n=1 Tax=Oceanicoccus sp. TaxID=2691044 RepID=UPI002616F102|nr:ATP-binding protein [Oceanicoccus sp.]MDG1773903.1 ATP-binding protein [Oceanicoccus sp.]